MREKFLLKHPELLLSPQSRLRDAMEAITKTQVGIALIVDGDNRLLGIVVDSDIRRALLRGDPMDEPVTKAMNREPFTADSALSDAEVGALFRQRRRAYIPLVDRAGRLAGLAALADYLGSPAVSPHWTVIMAGGLGTRLRPLTNATPKPMVQVGSKPILELTIERLVAAGLNRFIVSVNYLADQIQDYFGDGSAWGAQIEYLKEDKEMGTAGALGLIKRDLERSFLVMNADLLTKVNFRALLDFHNGEANLATMCVRQYDFQVPYGVVSLEDHKLASITEKPVHRFFVNAGIYVLEPQALSHLEKDKPCDMPALLERIRAKKNGGVGCFPIQEYWLDIGKAEDYQRALKEYEEQFKA